MKETVLDINDLQEIHPFFKSRFGVFSGNVLLKLLCIDKINEAHKNNCHSKGAGFTRSLLSDPLIKIKYAVHNEENLDNLPEGAFVTVSNHPVGSLDGIILIDIFASRRPDYKVMVNGLLAKIGAMADNFISVRPDSNHQGANIKNTNGVRQALERLLEGHPMGFFPAGAISFKDKKKNIHDLPWTHSVIRLIRKTNVSVYPIYFDFFNSNFFYFLGQIDWRIRTLRIPAEIFNKKGRILDVYIGKPISAEQIRTMEDDTELAAFLYNKTYGAKPK
jgi:putative hemolysin